MFCQDRNSRGGGVTILLSDHIPHCLHLDISEGHIESTWVELYPYSRQSLLIGCTYLMRWTYIYDYLSVDCESSGQHIQRILIWVCGLYAQHIAK